ncbi:MAG: hypothetical protein ABL909_02955 [Sphingopyxis sp.]
MALAGESDSLWVTLIDRWIYVFMAALFIATTLAGFIPDSLDKIAAVEAGQRPPFPPVLHVHAVLMGSWLMLLLAQTTLMATGNANHHKKLGLASFVLAPAIILTGIILVPTIYGQVWDAVQTAPPDMVDAARGGLAIRTDVMLLQMRAGLLFALFVFLAVRARRTDSGFHKRMIILATLVPLPAAINRIAWLPATMPESPLMLDILTLILISPMFFWDLFRLGRVHRAYIVWFALWLPAVVAVHLLWGSDWWQATAPRLLGYP